MEALWQTHKTSIIAVLLALVAVWSSMVVVPETEAAVVIQAGRPDRVANRFEPGQTYGETGAGIVFRVPFYERVERIDKRVLNVDMEPQTVLSTDQLRLNVDAYARYRIIDPVKMVRTAGTLATVDSQLSQSLSSGARQELGRRSFSALLAAERGTTMANITRLLDTQARNYGAQVSDVRIKQADLPDGTPLESAFRRMQSARAQEAATLRAQGQKNAQIIRA
ncbi:MAG: SPFH domain-containing protein, partial [Cypionkella sp.]